MRLHEEYIIRNKLDIPVICYDSKSTLFLKSKLTPFRWSIFNILFRQSSSRPGCYEFMRMEPVHDGEGAFKCLDKDHYVHWDKYESEIANFVNSYQKNGFYAVAKNERLLAAWEMFLYMYDGHLAMSMDKDFYEKVYVSTNLKLSLADRTVAYREANRMLASHFNSDNVLDMLNHRIIPMVKCHSKWLEDLVNA